MDFLLPQLGEGVYEAELVRYLIAPGTAVKPGQGLLEVMTDKATMEVPAAFSGTVTELLGTPGTPIKVGQLVLRYTGGGAAPEVKVAVPVVAAKAMNGHSATAIAAPAVGVSASPAVRHLARKLGIDLLSVKGSGPGGRVLLDDLSTRILTTTPAAPTAKKAREPQLDLGRAGTKMPFTGLRRKIAHHLVESRRIIPDFSYVDECDLSDVVKLRNSIKEPLAKHDVKLTYLAFVVKAVVQALKDVPLVNASLDEQAGQIVVHGQYHIGIAVAAPGGLLVPVIHDADQKDLFAIAKEIDRLSSEARAGRSKLDELKGSTFTVTSVGNIGGLISTPIIHHPNVGILGLGKAVKRPVYDDAGDIRPAEMVYLSFAFDHRVVDGAVGAVFGNAVIGYLQNPARLLLPDGLR